MGALFNILDYVHISQDCRQLLSPIIVANPARRITIKEIKSHPWFLKNLPRELVEAAHAVYFRKGKSSVCVQCDEEIMKIIEDAKIPHVATQSVGGFGWGGEEEDQEAGREAAEEDEYEKTVKEAQASGGFQVT